MWHVFIRSKWTAFGTGVLIGSAVAPVIGLAVRPLVLGLVKAGLLLQREGSTVMEGIREELEDIVAEARSEIDEKRSPTGGGHVHHERESSERAA